MPAQVLPTPANDGLGLKAAKANGSLARVDSFDAATATADEVVPSLIRNGGCFLRGLISTADAARIEREVRPFLDADTPWKGEFFPGETRRAMGLPGKSPFYVEKVPANPLYQAVAAQLLTTTSKMWIGQKLTENSSAPQLNTTAVISIGPGAKDQALHRDDSIHHNSIPAITATEYLPGRDTGLGLFVAGKRTTKQNGATRFIPGSHLQASEQPPPADEAGVVYAELETGDAFLMFSSCYHGGSANRTVDEERLLYSTFITRGYLRQEENQYLATPLDKVRQYPLDIQRLLGYSVSKPFLGWVDLEDPIKLVNPERAAGTEDLFGGG